MLEMCCYLEKKAVCKGVPKSPVLPCEPSRSLPAHWQLHCCLPLGRNVCVCACMHVCFCVRGQNTCNTASDGVAPLYHLASPLIRLGAESRERALVVLSSIPPASGALPQDFPTLRFCSIGAK